jgi:acetyl esterase/lipase
MAVGMYLHKRGLPVPPEPSFTRTIPSTLAKIPGNIGLYFYTPPGYILPRCAASFASTEKITAVTPDKPSEKEDEDEKEKKEESEELLYPVIVNFHGGGFTIGTPTDDARFFDVLTRRLGAVVVSVDYRLAPEHPFPTAVDDGADVVLWLHSRGGRECNLDPSRIALTGFSAGGNMCFSVPLRVHYEMSVHPGKRPKREYRPAAIAAFYPSTDFRAGREARRRTNLRPEKELPRVFTKLFDASYLYPPAEVALDNPFLSPAVAGDRECLEALAAEVTLVLCEWDELRQEGEKWGERLRTLGVGVRLRVVDGVGHGWDKTLNWEGRGSVAEECYEMAAARIGERFFGEREVKKEE